MHTTVRQAAHARATRRAELQASRQRCDDVLRDLPPTTPGSMHELCGAIRTQDGRPIRVHPMPMPSHGPAALLVAFPKTYVIVVDEKTNGFPRRRRLAHEAAHAALDHLQETMSAAWQRALWFPHLQPEFVERAMALTPGYYPTQQERDAEALGGRLLAAVLHGVADNPTDEAPGVEAGPLVGRRDALYRQFWQLRPLWVELVRTVPEAALFPPRSALADLTRITDLENRVTRQAIEILDVCRLLRDWLDPAVGSAARAHARRAGLADQHVEATAEAAMVAVAARAVRRGTPPAPGGVACASSVEGHAEAAWLVLVARAFTGPIVSRHFR